MFALLEKKSMAKGQLIAAINAGTCSLKFTVFPVAGISHKLVKAHLMGIGTAYPGFSHSMPTQTQVSFSGNEMSTHRKAATFMIQWIGEQMKGAGELAGIGYRVIQGGIGSAEYAEIDDHFSKKLKDLETLSMLEWPDTLPVIETFRQAFPDARHFACFDSYFNRHKLFDANYNTLPRALWKEDAVRYGLHGLSCQSILKQLMQEDPAIGEKKIIVAHLGQRCSVTAIKNGRCMDTSTCFRAGGGLAINRRTKDIDPAVITYLMKVKGMSATELAELFYKKNSLKAVPDSTGTISELLALEEEVPDARKILSMFCYQVRKHIGAFVAALGGLDTLVFTGGVGEYQPEIRMRICDGLAFMGLEIDHERNKAYTSSISREGSPVSIRVLPSNEDETIAMNVGAAMTQPPPR
jgi:acetate kinase